MRAANLDNEVSSWQSGQHTAAQTFMLEFAGVFIRAESSYFSCCGFGHWTCAFYTLSDRERVAGKYDMSAFLPTKIDKTAAAPPFIGSNQNQLPLPWRTARDGCFHRFTA